MAKEDKRSAEPKCPFRRHACRTAWAVIATSKDVTIDTELSYFSCQSRHEALVFIQKDTEQKRRICCTEALEFLAGFSVTAG